MYCYDSVGACYRLTINKLFAQLIDYLIIINVTVKMGVVNIIPILQGKKD